MSRKRNARDAFGENDEDDLLEAMSSKRAKLTSSSNSDDSDNDDDGDDELISMISKGIPRKKKKKTTNGKRVIMPKEKVFPTKDEEEQTPEEKKRAQAWERMMVEQKKQAYITIRRILRGQMGVDLKGEAEEILFREQMEIEAGMFEADINSFDTRADIKKNGRMIERILTDLLKRVRESGCGVTSDVPDLDFDADPEIVIFENEAGVRCINVADHYHVMQKKLITALKMNDGTFIYKYKHAHGTQGKWPRRALKKLYAELRNHQGSLKALKTRIMDPVEKREQIRQCEIDIEQIKSAIRGFINTSCIIDLKVSSRLGRPRASSSGAEDDDSSGGDN